ncbi:hypothetical protein A2774_02055 [Candidatus Roizmanbacteria bacterium RIFCSPHIGHO2_01_FULL_39_12c]|uniref:Glycosyl transferase family 1 domain-containing protein n=1 Tax=Candidatus Roizmanbacteria bacterium RIFCSPHIGHO2_01_FULL_39_12c TaxID=1802031 RepID=A0A1F7GDV4_9BACT|nr:MAG: hypothetical protein A2774_02055 [Candidatus Roizmanbacteria bacterium RIFCSPHIGHO2_01_FULL_39_12c]OGK47553.1 MAG: hypothetical protein A2963_00780 [Candidatus Roizmanbacteria bacterium RIFCSPLOWO2_01_FULL_40_13]
MKIAFFNYLMLEYGGGTGRFFIDAAIGLKQRYPNLKLSIFSLNKKLVKKIQSLYSFYFRRNIGEEQRLSNNNIKQYLRKSDINYETVHSGKELREKLQEADVVYSKNDLLELLILRHFVGRQFIHKLIIGFHTPVFYERPYNLQSYLHNFLYNSFIYKYLIKDADKYHVLNRFTEKRLRLWFADKEIKKIYNPFEFNSDNFSGEVTGNRYENRLNLLWVGRLTREKGVDDLIELIKELKKTKLDKKIKWLIAGSGEYEKEIKNLAKSYGNVKHFGFLNAGELKHLYQKSDLFLSTSRWESFPYTFIEAQSFGLLIIAYNIHGCKDIVEDGVNGYLVNSLEEFSLKLVDVIKNSKKNIKKKQYKRHIRKLINNQEILKEFYKLFAG